MLYLFNPANASTGARQLHYWPCELLHAFTLEMAAHGICVHEAMMLGDADYAHQKLSQASALHDPTVDQLVVNMRNYFECLDPVG
jgi:hypothetical protein